MKEPLKHLVDKHGFDVSQIKQVVCGAKYTAVLLKDGTIGVCANLLNRIPVEVGELRSPDLNQMGHRIIVSAYFNGILNGKNHHSGDGDIFEGVDFKRYKHLVMIGLFKPVVKKLIRNHIRVTVFDMIKKNPRLEKEEKKMGHVREADGVILSATSIVNKTFMDMVNATTGPCDVYLLGPSSILDRDMFRYKNIRRIYGSRFKLNDQRVLNAIGNGYGTRRFLPFGNKVFLQP